MPSQEESLISNNDISDTLTKELVAWQLRDRQQSLAPGGRPSPSHGGDGEVGGTRPYQQGSRNGSSYRGDSPRSPRTEGRNEDPLRRSRSQSSPPGAGGRSEGDRMGASVSSRGRGGGEGGGSLKRPTSS